MRKDKQLESIRIRNERIAELERNCDRYYMEIGALNLFQTKLNDRIAKLEAAIVDLRVAALTEDWHTFDRIIADAGLERK